MLNHVKGLLVDAGARWEFLLTPKLRFWLDLQSIPISKRCTAHIYTIVRTLWPACEYDEMSDEATELKM